MVITNKEIEQTYLFSKKVEFSIGDSETEYVELREFNMEQAKQFQQAAKISGEDMDAVAALNKAEEFFPSCVVDSSFVHENGDKLTGKEVYNYLKKSSQLFQLILQTWLKNDDSPFHLANKKN